MDGKDLIKQTVVAATVVNSPTDPREKDICFYAGETRLLALSIEHEIIDEAEDKTLRLAQLVLTPHIHNSLLDQVQSAFAMLAEGKIDQATYFKQMGATCNQIRSLLQGPVQAPTPQVSG